MKKNEISIKAKNIPPFAKKQLQLKGGKFSAGAGAYYGASRTRRATYGWKPGLGDADADTLPDQKELIARSRDMVRNVPVATGALMTNQLHIVGSGLKMQSTINRNVLQMSEEDAAALQKVIESEWGLWADNLDCSLNRKANFAGNQSLVLRSALESGDVFVLLPYELRRTSPYGLKLQLIEADRVSNKDNTRNTTSLAGGVHTDKQGAPTAYDIRTTNPGSEKSFGNNWTTVEAFNKAGRPNILHVYEQLRPDQTRGMPYLAPITEIIKQLSKYTNAEIAAAVINSCFTVFVKSPSGNVTLSPLAKNETQDQSNDSDYKLESGAIIDLAEGDDVVFADPKRPNQNFDSFVISLYRQIGAALSIPYELLVYQFTSSYSASRSAMLLAWKMFITRRIWLENHFCNLVYERWFEEAVLLGRVVAPGFMEDLAIRAAYLQNHWVGPNPGQIDPVKETNAALARINGRLSSHEAETAAMGKDWDKVISQIAYEETTMKEKGVSFVGEGTSGGSGQAIINAEAQADSEDNEDSDNDSDDQEDSE